MQQGKGGRAGGGCFTSGKKLPADPLLPSPGSVPGENVQETGAGDRATEDMLNQHVTGALGRLFHSGFQWRWAGNPFCSETQHGKEFPTSVYLP